MSETPNQASLDEDHWEIYVTYVDEKPAVILVDIGVAKAAPLPRLTHLVWVWVHLQNPDEQGFPSDDENDSLNDLEDALTESMDGTHVRYVGRVTTDGRREFYFYTDEPSNVRNVAESALKTLPDYRFEIDQDEDETWSHYQDVLYPSPEDFQQIGNQRVIDQLQQAGDTLTEPRPVDHFANFKSEADRDAFIAEAEKLNFEAVSRPVRESDPEFPYSVGLLRVDLVDPDSIDNLTFELFQLANEHHGEYDGWSCPVVKPGQSK